MVQCIRVSGKTRTGIFSGYESGTQWVVTRKWSDKQETCVNFNDARYWYWYSNSARLSRSGILSKRLNILSYFLQHILTQWFYTVSQKTYYTKLVAINVSILNGFSKFFHCWWRVGTLHGRRVFTLRRLIIRVRRNTRVMLIERVSRYIVDETSALWTTCEPPHCCPQVFGTSLRVDAT